MTSGESAGSARHLRLAGGPMVQCEHVERGDDALQRRAELVAHLGEEELARQDRFARRSQARALVLDRPRAVHPADQRREQRRHQGQHQEERQGQLDVVPPERGREKHRRREQRRRPGQNHRADAVTNPGATE